MDRVRWLIVFQSSVMHVLQSATQFSVSQCISSSTSVPWSVAGTCLLLFLRMCVSLAYVTVVSCPAVSPPGPSGQTRTHSKPEVDGEVAANKLARFTERVLFHSSQQV